MRLPDFKKFILSAVLILLINLCYSQALGYLGKRFNVGANWFLSPTIYVFEAKDDIKSLNVSRFKPNAQFEINYSISKKLEISGQYRHEKDYVEYTSNNVYIPGANYSSFYFDKNFEDQKLIYNYYSIGIKSYIKSNISPVGKYIQFNAGVINFHHPDQSFGGGYILGNYDYPPDAAHPYGYTVQSKTLVNLKKKGTFVRLSIAYGKNIMLSERLIFGFKYQFNYSLRKSKVFNYGTVTESEIENKLLGSIAYQYKRWTDVFALKIGLNYLIF